MLTLKVIALAFALIAGVVVAAYTTHVRDRAEVQQMQQVDEDALKARVAYGAARPKSDLSKW